MVPGLFATNELLTCQYRNIISDSVGLMGAREIFHQLVYRSILLFLLP